MGGALLNGSEVDGPSFGSGVKGGIVRQYRSTLDQVHRKVHVVRASSASFRTFYFVGHMVFLRGDVGNCTGGRKANARYGFRSFVGPGGPSGGFK